MVVEVVEVVLVVVVVVDVVVVNVVVKVVVVGVVFGVVVVVVVVVVIVVVVVVVIFSKFTEFIRNSLVDPSKNSSWEQAVGQGHQRFTPEYVIKNQTKPHLRNYSFLHIHFLTTSQTKLLIP